MTEKSETKITHVDPFAHALSRVHELATGQGKIVTGHIAQLIIDECKGRIPEEWLDIREARGGRKLRYIKHHKIRQLALLLYPGFSWTQGDFQLYYGKNPEVPSTVASYGELGLPDILMIQEDGVVKYIHNERKVGARGVFDNVMKLNSAAATAAADSRAFVKAFTFATGFGLELYTEDEEELLTTQIENEMVRREDEASGKAEEKKEPEKDPEQLASERRAWLVTRYTKGPNAVLTIEDLKSVSKQFKLDSKKLYDDDIFDQYDKALSEAERQATPKP